MLISSVIGSLEHDARMEIARAETTPDYREVIVHIDRARRLQAMAQAVRQVAAQDVLQVPAPVAAGGVVVPMRKRAAAGRPVAAPKAPKLTAWEFWRMHGQAVDAVRAVYGDAWKIRAPFGDTVLAMLPAGFKSAKTERGTVIKWASGYRMPAAKYWPDGRLPDGLVIEADYPRANGRSGQETVATEAFRRELRDFRSTMIMYRRERRGIIRWQAKPGEERANATAGAVRLLAARADLRALGVNPWKVGSAHDDAWHLAHGYIWDGLKWVSELGDRASRAHAEAIEDNRLAAIAAKEAKRVAKLEAACLSYGPQPLQPFADIADDLDLAEAAD